MCPPYAPETYICSPFIDASKRCLPSQLLPGERLDRWWRRRAVETREKGHYWCASSNAAAPIGVSVFTVDWDRSR
ncbi:hypothetical protein CDO22_20855 (plasmid) [Sinorhizobium meliloti]|nr:hypothetical protein CDO24_31685 [Sinorhizobium meliloti]ASQ12589.1 hypothetical protein CDO22_20855 [Sinorhizobium meliloti]PTD30713.1 hypothetical protein C5N13_00955 [Sinorhizobium meliloti]